MRARVRRAVHAVSIVLVFLIVACNNLPQPNIPQIP